MTVNTRSHSAVTAGVAQNEMFCISSVRASWGSSGQCWHGAVGGRWISARSQLVWTWELVLGR